jgi:aminoacylase
LTFVPDEEIGGGEGMCALLNSNILDLKDIEVALDEGLANPNNAFSIFYGERTVKWIIIKAEGPVGHGS